MPNQRSFDLEGSAFVTGATGFLGCEIARQLVSAGVRVRALSRSGQLPGDLTELGVEVVPGDLGDVARLADALGGCAAVFHVAASVGMWRRNWVSSVQGNVTGTRNMVRAALEARVSRFVLTSSASTIGKPLRGNHREVTTIDESWEYNLHELGMVYPHTKWLAEQEVLEGVSQGLDAVITHPTAVLGPGDWKLNTLPLFKAPRNGMALAVPRGHRTVCDVRDVAQGHLQAAERGATGERYILGGESMSVGELFERIARETGGLRPLIRLPDRALTTVGGLLELKADLTGKAPLLTWEMALQSTFRVRASSAKAQSELGYECRDPQASIRDAVAWFRQRGVL